MVKLFGMYCNRQLCTTYGSSLQPLGTPTVASVGTLAYHCGSSRSLAVDVDRSWSAHQGVQGVSCASIVAIRDTCRMLPEVEKHSDQYLSY